MLNHFMNSKDYSCNQKPGLTWSIPAAIKLIRPYDNKQFAINLDISKNT